MNPTMGFTKSSFHSEVPEEEFAMDTPKDRLSRDFVGDFLRRHPSTLSHDK